MVLYCEATGKLVITGELAVRFIEAAAMQGKTEEALITEIMADKLGRDVREIASSIKKM